jgi:hypothetical protein
VFFSCQSFLRRTAATLLLLPAGCALVPLFVHEVSLPYEELTTRLSKRFPMERNIADFLNVTLMRPRVSPIVVPAITPATVATAAPRLAVTVDLEVKLPSLLNKTQRSLWGSMTISGIPRFDNLSRSVMLDDAKLDRVRVDNMPDALSAALAKTATQLAKEYLEAKPIYALTAEQIERLGLNSTATVLAFEVQSDRLVIRKL